MRQRRYVTLVMRIDTKAASNFEESSTNRERFRWTPSSRGCQLLGLQDWSTPNYKSLPAPRACTASHHKMARKRLVFARLDHVGVLSMYVPQALETATWAAMLKAPRAVLAGDHLQLPPTVLSDGAAAGGLGRTLFERLHALHPDASSMLTVQYRMHEDIMRWSSDELYAGGLGRIQHAGIGGMRRHNSVHPCLILWVTGMRPPVVHQRRVKSTCQCDA